MSYTTAALAFTLTLVSVSATVSRNLFLYTLCYNFFLIHVMKLLRWDEMVVAKCIDGRDKEKIWSIGLMNLTSLWDPPLRKVLLREEAVSRLNRSAFFYNFKIDTMVIEFEIYQRWKWIVCILVNSVGITGSFSTFWVTWLAQQHYIPNAAYWHYTVLLLHKVHYWYYFAMLL